MRARTKTIVNTELFKLTKHSSQKTRRIHYTVSVNSGSHWIETSVWKDMDLVRKLFNPAGNRGSATGFKWKFRTRQEAEQLITIAILKWSAK